MSMENSFEGVSDGHNEFGDGWLLKEQLIYEYDGYTDMLMCEGRSARLFN
jgi:hypothetical protein